MGPVKTDARIKRFADEGKIALAVVDVVHLASQVGYDIGECVRYLAPLALESQIVDLDLDGVQIVAVLAEPCQRSCDAGKLCCGNGAVPSGFAPVFPDTISHYG
jgi:hypothetical protein